MVQTQDGRGCGIFIVIWRSANHKYVRGKQMQQNFPPGTIVNSIRSAKCVMSSGCEFGDDEQSKFKSPQRSFSRPWWGFCLPKDNGNQSTIILHNQSNS